MDKVLVIEDNLSNAQLIINLMRAWGYEVLHIPDGHQACAALAELTPRLIFLDLRLPGVDGWALARHIKGDARLAHVPIIAISVEIDPDDRLLAFQAGCDAYFAKPFNIQELKICLHQWLG